MITIKEFMELVDYKITEGSSYGWECYGPNAYTLDSWNGVHGKGGYSFSIVFSTKSQKVYEVSVCDYTNNRAYRMINPDYVKKHSKEAKARGINLTEAWDEVNYVDLDVVDDFIQKERAIKAGETYDTRVMMQFDLPNDLLLQIALQAHAEDITLNEYITKALSVFKSRVDSGEFTAEDAKKILDNRTTDYRFGDEVHEE